METQLLIKDFFVIVAEHPWSVTIIIGLIQLFCYFSTVVKSLQLLRFFKGTEDIIIVEDQILYEENVIGKRLQILFKNINAYLSKSKGAANNSVIQNKVDRVIDSMVQNAGARVSFPTLIGLMGTFLGVLCGLVAFKEGLSLELGVTNQHVSELIQGVVIAMTTSLLGLILTTHSNHLIAYAQKIATEKKLNLFDFFQTELMPSQSSDMVSAVNKLDRTILTFVPNFHDEISAFQHTFQESSRNLNSVFSSGVTEIRSAIETLKDSVDVVHQSVKSQEELIDTLNSRSMQDTLHEFLVAGESFSLATATIKDLERYKQSLLSAFNKFTEKQNQFYDALEIPKDLLSKINEILNRVVTFENSINSLGTTISQSDILGNKEMEMIEEHLSSIKEKSRLADEYQKTANEELKNFYEDEIESLKNLTAEFEQSLSEHSSRFDGLMDMVLEDLSQKRDGMVQVLTESFNLEDVQQDLLHLKNLDIIKEHVASIDSSDQANLTYIKSSLDRGEVVMTKVHNETSEILDNVQKLKIAKRDSVVEDIPTVVLKKKKSNIFGKLFGFIKKK